MTRQFLNDSNFRPAELSTSTEMSSAFEANAVAEEPSAMRRKTYADIIALTILAILAVGFVLPAVWRGSILGLYPSDGTRNLFFAREYLVGSLSEFRLPLWNPYIQFGAPFLADMQWGVLEPFNWLFTSLNPQTAYNTYVMLHLALPAMSLYLLARDWKLDPAPSLVAALAFAWGARPVAIAWGGGANMLSAASWFPLAMLSFDRCARAGERRWMWWALTTVIVAIQILSGHPQITFFSLFAMLALALWYRTIWSVSAAFAIIVAAMAVAAVQIVPSYEAAQASTRNVDWVFRWPRDIEGSYNPLRLVTWLVPNIFGNPVSLRPAATDWLSLVMHEQHSSESAAYFGVLPLMFALFSLEVCRQDHRVRFLWILAGVGFVLALGRFTPLYGALYAVAPPVRSFRIPARFLWIVIFSLSLLAGYGMQAFLDDRHARYSTWSRGALAAGVLVAVGAVMALLFRSPLLAIGSRMAAPLFATRPAAVALANDARVELVRSAHALAIRSVATASGLLVLSAVVFRRRAEGHVSGAFIGFILAIVLGDLSVHAAPYTSSENLLEMVQGNALLLDPVRAAGEQTHAYTTEAGVHPDPIRPNDNLFISEHLYTAAGYEGFELRTYREIRNLLDEDLRRGSSYAVSIFGIRFVAADVPIEARDFTALASSSTATMYLNRTALPRAYVAGHAIAVPDAAVARQLLRSHSIRLGEELLVEAPSLPVNGDAGIIGSAVVRTLSPESIRIVVDAARAGYVVLNDSFFPGWKATVDGRAADILRANGHVRAVAITAGHHEVDMRYAPRSFTIGIYITLVSAALVGLVAVAGSGVVPSRTSMASMHSAAERW